jgi:hypothetical protein
MERRAGEHCHDAELSRAKLDELLRSARPPPVSVA